MKKLLLIVCLIFSPLCFAQEKMVVIVNANNEASFDKVSISRMYIGRIKSFTTGEKAIVLQPNSMALQDQFNQYFLSRSSVQVKAYWSKMLFSGKAKPPRQLSSNEIVKQVESNPFYIGYVSEKDINDAVRVVFRFP
ncbi:phosphate ABC transporter substrate-binding protein [Catenovulum sp. SM1970]|uniref:phosphate ABC transporter substrate-binding protein n=1 Tax=Marinifaba aquimaris TaxID=2741323 RepID=UPI001573A50E|nr:phosphate ABC transporter substrate-binding protein [Marinifaba aquimaris]NTS77711.1 phosphate ABC transporter substrate-binding protein [Marinifaba aquimaris]